MDLIALAYQESMSPKASKTIYSKSFDYPIQCLFGWYSCDSMSNVINNTEPTIMINGNSLGQNSGSLNISGQLVSITIKNIGADSITMRGSVLAWVIPV